MFPVGSWNRAGHAEPEWGSQLGFGRPLKEPVGQRLYGAFEQQSSQALPYAPGLGMGLCLFCDILPENSKTVLEACQDCGVICESPHLLLGVTETPGFSLEFEAVAEAPTPFFQARSTWLGVD